MTDHQAAIERLKQQLNTHVERIKQELDEGLSQIPAQKDTVGAGSGIQDVLKMADTFANTYSQVELLNSLLELGSAHVPRIALFILKESQIHGWEAKGFSPEFCTQKVKKVHWKVSRYPELVEAVERRSSLTRNFSDLSDLAEAVKAFDGYVPFMTCFHPVVVRNKVAAVIYADSGSESTLGQPEMLRLLAYLAGLELTMITTRLKKPQAFKKPPAEPTPEPKKPEQPVQKIPDPMIPAPQPEPEPPAPQPQPQPPTAAEPHRAMTPPATQQPRDRTQEKNKRVARVLVSDIKLYHESTVAKGQKEGNLYVLLREDIDRSFQHYQEKTRGKVPEGVNYFKDELIRQLTDGHPELMGDLPF